MKKFLLAFFALSLTACATKEWSHPYKKEGEFYADNAYCQSMAGNGAQPTAYDPRQGSSPAASFQSSFAQVSQAKRRQNLYTSCMMGEGWR